MNEFKNILNLDFKKLYTHFFVESGFILLNYNNLLVYLLLTCISQNNGGREIIYR